VISDRWSPDDLGAIQILEPVFQPGDEYRFTVGVRDTRKDGAVKYSNVFTVEE
jgi:hypothetical protein